MGVKGLKKLVTRFSHEIPVSSIQKYIVASGRRKMLALDANNLVHKFYHYYNDPLDSIFHFLSLLHAEPVFFFDQKFHEDKVRTQERKEKDKVHENLTRLQNALTKSGIPFFFSSGIDAEGLAAKKIGYVFSYDSDTIPYGAKRWFFDYNRRKETIKHISPHEIMTKLGFTNFAQLLHFCILLGTDFNKRIMSERKALKFMRGESVSSRYSLSEIADTIIRVSRIYLSDVRGFT